jgi:hypothetical protein
VDQRHAGQSLGDEPEDTLSFKSWALGQDILQKLNISNVWMTLQEASRDEYWTRYVSMARTKTPSNHTLKTYLELRQLFSLPHNLPDSRNTLAINQWRRGDTVPQISM